MKIQKNQFSEKKYKNLKIEYGDKMKGSRGGGEERGRRNKLCFFERINKILKLRDKLKNKIVLNK